MSGGDYGDIMLGAGIGAVFGAVSPMGGIVGLGGSLLGIHAAAQAQIAGQEWVTLSMGWEFGGMIGGLAGDVGPAVLKAAKISRQRALLVGLAHAGPDLAGAGVGGIAGYGIGGDLNSAYHGATMGMMAGSLAGVAARGAFGVARARGVNSLSSHIDGFEEFTGDLSVLTSELRNRNHPWLTRIADRYSIEDADALVKILDTAEFAAVQMRRGMPEADVVGFFWEGVIYLRRDRGTQILTDFVHEATHAIDFAKGGVFHGVDPDLMSPLQILRREVRAYRAERLVTRHPYPFGGRQRLVDHIVRRYSAARPR